LQNHKCSDSKDVLAWAIELHSSSLRNARLRVRLPDMAAFASSKAQTTLAKHASHLNVGRLPLVRWFHEILPAEPACGRSYPTF
jgi:hypothetical protein